MGQFDIKTEVSTLMGQKFGSYYASEKALNCKYALCKGGDDKKLFRIFFENKGTFNDPIINDIAVGNIYDKNGKRKYEINDLTTGRSYSTGWHKSQANQTKDKFDTIKTHGYTIKDNGNGIVDEEDTIQGGVLKEPITLGRFLNGSVED